jgi:hypothetical protein
MWGVARHNSTATDGGTQFRQIEVVRSPAGHDNPRAFLPLELT